jgi:hypothetical protein
VNAYSPGPSDFGAAEVDEVEFTTTDATSLRYDSTAGHFVQNWRTPTTKNRCYTVTMTTDDGSSLEARFRTR